jgi:predicted membrane protein
MNLRVLKSLYSFFVTALYLVFGFYLLLKYFFWQEEPSISFSVFGLFVLIYGFFRGYRAFKTYQSEKEDEDEIE